MNTIKLWLVLLFLFAQTAFAMAPAARKTVPELLQMVSASNFTYQGKAILSGYYSTESCLFTSDELAVLINYCGKGKDYPARSISVLSRDHGLVQFYEEKMDTELYKVIRLQLFNGELKPVLPLKAHDINLKHADKAYALLSEYTLPACWSVNQAPGDGCHRFDASEVANWHNANRPLMHSQQEWDTAFSQILSHLPKPLLNK